MTKRILPQLFLEAERAKPMWVCQDCLTDEMLKAMKPSLLEERRCSSCGGLSRSALTPERIANFIREYLPVHFQVDDGRYPGYELTLESIIKAATGCNSEAVCLAIAERLEDQSADEDSFYWPGQEYCGARDPFDSEEHEKWYITSEWRNIAVQLTHGRRFFNDRAQQFFESLIVEALGARDAEHADRSAVVTTLAAGSFLFRARLASSTAEARKFALNPAEALGAPPRERAANNRMSAAGIPLLYVSSDPDTCIAEIRPSIGDTVAVGRFETTATLDFFDFTALNRELQHGRLSLFDSRHEKKSHHRRLLTYLHEEIARPVRSGDTDYVMTQALAEFIRYSKLGKFDGIAFQSVQRAGGINYVLFDKSEPATMLAPQWRPTFDVKIESANVSVHTVTGVSYFRKEAEG